MPDQTVPNLLLFLVIFASVLVLLWGVTVVLVLTGRLKGKDWINNALGLPDGSVRALLALLILAFVFWIALGKVELKDLPQWATGILGTVIGFYFGAQTVSSAQQGKKQTASITTTSLPDGKPSITYSAKLAAVGVAIPCTWSIIKGSLPAGLSMAPATGDISGTPTTVAQSNFTVEVTDSLGNSASKALSITIV